MVVCGTCANSIDTGAAVNVYLSALQSILANHCKCTYVQQIFSTIIVVQRILHRLVWHASPSRVEGFGSGIRVL